MKNPTNKCMCGCGRAAPPSPTSRRGYKRGEPLRFIRGHSSRKASEYHEEDRGYILNCWMWDKLISWTGHGRGWCSHRNKVIGAHQLIYERFLGRVPDLKELHHICEQRDCVNPNHLVAVTRKEHMQIDGRLPYGNPYSGHVEDQ